MICDHCQAIEEIFDHKMAVRDLERYQRQGPEQSTRLLLAALQREGVKGRSLLDIGGGIGAIQHELVKAGVRQTADVDASLAYLRQAQEEAARQGYREQADYYHGDYVDLAADVGSADIVTLDRVICCYPDMENLVKLSSAHARQLYGVVYPRDAWWVRWGAKLIAPLIKWFRRTAFTIYVHPTQAIDQLIRANGLQLRYRRNAGLIWQVFVYARSE